jgi:[ribosomal protein S5]-alanine N-acetyltransferase
MRAPEPIATERLDLVPFTLADAPFMLEMLNDPGYLRFVADRGIRTEEEAARYLAGGPIAMYERHGLGLLRVVRRSDGESLGICGLLRRDALEDVDIGFALLERHRGFGYAREAADAVVRHGTTILGLRRIAGIVLAENGESIGLLGALGMRRERAIDIGGEALELYLLDLDGASP